MSKLATLFATPVIATSLLGATALFAAEQSGQPAPTQVPAAGSSDMHGMMQGGDMSKMDQMMGMMEQMNRMMAECTNMMKSMHESDKSGPSEPGKTE